MLVPIIDLSANTMFFLSLFVAILDGFFIIWIFTSFSAILNKLQTRPGVSPVNIPVSAQVNPTSQLLSKPASPQECPLSQVTHLVDNVKQMVPNDSNKDGDSNLPSREHVAGNKASPFSGSQYGVAANGLTANADKHDSLTDEKMLKIVRELVTVGIAQTEVGKAAEVCYKDPVKALVLFALPDHLRKSYVRGFLYPRK